MHGIVWYILYKLICIDFYLLTTMNSLIDMKIDEDKESDEQSQEEEEGADTRNDTRNNHTQLRRNHTFPAMSAPQTISGGIGISDRSLFQNQSGFNYGNIFYGSVDPSNRPEEEYSALSVQRPAGVDCSPMTSAAHPVVGSMGMGWYSSGQQIVPLGYANDPRLSAGAGVALPVASYPVPIPMRGGSATMTAPMAQMYPYVSSTVVPSATSTPVGYVGTAGAIGVNRGGPMVVGMSNQPLLRGGYPYTTYHPTALSNAGVQSYAMYNNLGQSAEVTSANLAGSYAAALGLNATNAQMHSIQSYNAAAAAAAYGNASVPAIGSSTSSTAIMSKEEVKDSDSGEDSVNYPGGQSQVERQAIVNILGAKNIPSKCSSSYLRVAVRWNDIFLGHTNLLKYNEEVMWSEESFDLMLPTSMSVADSKLELQLWQVNLDKQIIIVLGVKVLHGMALDEFIKNSESSESALASDLANGDISMTSSLLRDDSKGMWLKLDHVDNKDNKDSNNNNSSSGNNNNNSNNNINNNGGYDGDNEYDSQQQRDIYVKIIGLKCHTSEDDRLFEDEVCAHADTRILSAYEDDVDGGGLEDQDLLDAELNANYDTLYNSAVPTTSCSSLSSVSMGNNSNHTSNHHSGNEQSKSLNSGSYVKVESNADKTEGSRRRGDERADHGKESNKMNNNYSQHNESMDGPSTVVSTGATAERHYSANGEIKGNDYNDLSQSSSSWSKGAVQLWSNDDRGNGTASTGNSQNQDNRNHNGNNGASIIQNFNNNNSRQMTQITTSGNAATHSSGTNNSYNNNDNSGNRYNNNDQYASTVGGQSTGSYQSHSSSQHGSNNIHQHNAQGDAITSFQGNSTVSTTYQLPSNYALASHPMMLNVGVGGINIARPASYPVMRTSYIGGGVGLNMGVGVMPYMQSAQSSQQPSSTNIVQMTLPSAAVGIARHSVPMLGGHSSHAVIQYPANMQQSSASSSAGISAAFGSYAASDPAQNQYYYTQQQQQQQQQIGQYAYQQQMLQQQQQQLLYAQRQQQPQQQHQQLPTQQDEQHRTHSSHHSSSSSYQQQQQSQQEQHYHKSHSSSRQRQHHSAQSHDSSQNAPSSLTDNYGKEETTQHQSRTHKRSRAVNASGSDQNERHSQFKRLREASGVTDGNFCEDEDIAAAAADFLIQDEEVSSDQHSSESMDASANTNNNNNNGLQKKTSSGEAHLRTAVNTLLSLSGIN